MENAVCPFCNSEKTSSMKAYCSIISNENTQRFLKGIQPTFRYGIHVGIAGIAMIIAAFIIGNSQAYINTFYTDYSVLWKRHGGPAGVSFPGVLGIVMVAGTGIVAIVWGYLKHTEDMTIKTSREQDKRFYDSAIVCQDCRKAWVSGFEDKYRIL